MWRDYTNARGTSCNTARHVVLQSACWTMRGARGVHARRVLATRHSQDSQPRRTCGHRDLACTHARMLARRHAPSEHVLDEAWPAVLFGDLHRTATHIQSNTHGRAHVHHAAQACLVVRVGCWLRRVICVIWVFKKSRPPTSMLGGRAGVGIVFTIGNAHNGPRVP